MDESRKRVIAIVAGILVEKQFLEEDFRQNGISPRAQFCPFQRLTLARAHPAACGWRLRKQLKWTLGVANMKHKFTGEICVYCNKAPSETKDHTVGRKFFLEERRGGLPQVPACRNCNNKKAAAESYLMTVLPFGRQLAPTDHSKLLPA